MNWYKNNYIHVLSIYAAINGINTEEYWDGSNNLFYLRYR